MRKSNLCVAIYAWMEGHLKFSLNSPFKEVYNYMYSWFQGTRDSGIIKNQIKIQPWIKYYLMFSRIIEFIVFD